MKSNYTVVLSPQARKDLREAIKWYNNIGEGLGNNLKTEILAIIENIIINADYCSINYDITRMAACKKFPYTVHYFTDDETKHVYIHSIFHTTRKPKWEE